MKSPSLKIKETGRVIGISGPVIKIEGLPNVEFEEVIKIGSKRGIVFRFCQELTKTLVGPKTLESQDIVYALALDNAEEVKIGEKVERTKKSLVVPVGEKVLGKIINPLGEDIETQTLIEGNEFREIERKPPQVLEREEIREPLETGIKIIDALFPIGRGQRQLIVGDRKTGKTTLALDAILNQKDVICIYTSIGQKISEVLKIFETLQREGALDYTTIISAFAADSPVLKYLAPFTAMTIGEYFRDKGKDVLVVFDDLTKHAWAWREISLLLKRAPGREAYPGDIFYLHARLLERAAKLNKKNGGGSITALPICETKEGDITEYIPTNLISITDGQLYLETDLFQKGIKPAINIGLSVSRIGSLAQRKCIKEITQGMKLLLSQHQELKKLIQLETKLSPKSQKIFQRGEILLEIFKQEKHELVDVANQSMIYFATLNGFFDNLDKEKIKNLELRFYEFINSLHLEFKRKLLKEGWTEEIKQEFKKIINEFKLIE